MDWSFILSAFYAIAGVLACVMSVLLKIFLLRLWYSHRYEQAFSFSPREMRLAHLLELQDKENRRRQLKKEQGVKNHAQKALITAKEVEELQDLMAGRYFIDCEIGLGNLANNQVEMIRMKNLAAASCIKSFEHECYLVAVKWSKYLKRTVSYFKPKKTIYSQVSQNALVLGIESYQVTYYDWTPKIVLVLPAALKKLYNSAKTPLERSMFRVELKERITKGLSKKIRNTIRLQIIDAF